MAASSGTSPDFTVICGFSVLFSSQLGVVERAACYYSVTAFALSGAVALVLAQPITLVMISANVGGFVMMFLSLHTIVVNSRFLPRAPRPAVWREAALVVTQLFYGFFVIAAVAGALAYAASAVSAASRL